MKRIHGAAPLAATISMLLAACATAPLDQDWASSTVPASWGWEAQSDPADGAAPNGDWASADSGADALSAADAYSPSGADRPLGRQIDAVLARRLALQGADGPGAKTGAATRPAARLGSPRALGGSADPAAGPRDETAAGQGAFAAGPGVAEGDAARLSDADFWRALGDPGLNAAMDAMIRNNADLRMAQETLRKAVLSRRMSGSSLIPSFSAGASASKRLDDDNGAKGKNGGAWAGVGGGLGGSSGNDARYGSSFSAAYQADVFGALAKDYVASSRDALAALDRKRGVYLTLAGQTAGLYWRVLADRERLALAREALADAKGMARLFEAKYRAGAISKGDWLLTQSNLDAAFATALSAEKQTRSDEASLAVVVGASPLGAAALVAGDRLPHPRLPELLASSPAQTLANRPDVASALKALIASADRVDAAARDFFPTLRLSYAADAGGGTDWADLLSHPVGAVAANLALPFLDIPRKIIQSQSARSDYDAQAARYRQTLANALKEIAVVRQDRIELDERLKLAEANAQTAQELSRIARVRYEAGADPLENWLNRKAARRSAQNELLDLRLRRLQNFLDRYAAIGGSPDNALLASWLGWAEGKEENGDGQAQPRPLAIDSGPAAQKEPIPWDGAQGASLGAAPKPTPI